MGEATVVFSNEEIKKYNFINEYTGSGALNILATVSEELTEIQRNGTAEVKFAANCGFQSVLAENVIEKFFFLGLGLSS